MEKIFPKVLIVGIESFSQNSGTGITMTNLFREWPEEKIAVAALKNDLTYCINKRPCYAYYSFSYNHEKNVKSIKKNRKLFHLLKKVISKAGILDFFSPIRINNEFLTFFDKFKPEIVYTPLGNIPLMRLILELKRLREFKLAIHIMYDWLIGSYNYRWCPFIWKKIAYKFITNILSDHNTICMSISQAMSDEYKQRYGVNFSPFHNPIEPNIWSEISNQKINKELRITYLAKINRNTHKNLLDLSKAVEKLNENGAYIKFIIYTPDYDEKNVSRFTRYKYTELFPSVSQEQIPVIIQSSSFLFLPLGFDQKSIEYTRLSMPTKITEYLISKRAIILNCPEELAVFDYLMKHNAAIICKQGVNNIYSVLYDLLDNNGVVEDIVNNAYNLAINNHTGDNIREKFRSALCNKI